jgi:hypothetical protein
MNGNRRSAALQVGVVALLLSAIAAAVYGPQAVHGGFLSDAWSNRAIYVFSEGHGFFGKVSDLLDKPNIAVRPLQAVYLVALNGLFGSHVGFWLTWQLITNVIMCLAFFLLLRQLSLPAIDAGAIAVLVLVFPAASAIRFWLATIWAPLSVTLVCTGFLLALIAFDAGERRRAFILHVISLACFVASILLYEVALLVLLFSVLLYRLQVRFGRAIRRWVVDCGVLMAVTLTVTLSSSAGHEESSAGVWTHGKVIAEQARILFTTVVLPLNGASWYILLLLALVPLGAALAYQALPDSSADRKELLRWFSTMAGGIVVVILGYAIYAPGTDYYIPLGPGIVNRINAIPSIGWVLILYAGLMLVTTLAARGLPRPRIAASGFAACACALIAIGWLNSVGDYSGYFSRAYEEDVRVLTTVKSVLPQPRSHSTIWTFGQPVEIVPGVPVFGNTWDMTSSIQLTYGDPTITSYVAYPETGFVCDRREIAPNGPSWSGTKEADRLYHSRYGRTYFVDTNSGKLARIDSPAQCRRVAREFVPSPQYPSQ